MIMPDINKMPLREKLGQLLIVRMCDLVMDADSSYTKMRAHHEAAELMEKNQFGGIWLHGSRDVNHINDVWINNVSFDSKELKEWYVKARKNVKIPIIAAADPNGKYAARDLSVYPTAICAGASADSDIAFDMGQCIARELGWSGLDWIWAPVADLHNPYSSGIGRSFSNHPDDLIKNCTDYIKGVQSQRMAATVKHFPGVDSDETRDSHIVTTNINCTMDEWWKSQGRVFKEIIDAGVDSVMSVATSFPAADDTQINGRYVPAGLSQKILTGLLKNEMGFDGVVVTDDVTMGGFTSFYSDGRLYAELIKAGNDMLLGVGVDAVDLLEEEVKNGTVSMERIDDAVTRVLKLKKKVGLFDIGYREPDYTVLEAVEATRKMSAKLAETSLTLVCDRNKILPFDSTNLKNVAIVCYSHDDDVTEKICAMKEEFENRGMHVVVKKRLNSFEEAKSIADTNDLIVYVGYIDFHVPKGAPSFYGDEFWSLRHAFVYGAEKSVGYGMGYPHIHYNFMPDANVFVNSYTTAPEMQRAFVKGIFGEISFVGKSPVKLDE